MKKTLVTAPTIYPIGTADLKVFLRIDTSEYYDGAEDELLESILYTAIDRAEHVTQRHLLTQTWDLNLDIWPRGSFIEVPGGNLQSVTHVKYKDSNGDETTLTVDVDYIVEKNGDDIGRVVLPYGIYWPTDSLYPSNPITIRYIAGWTTPTGVPGGIKSAIRLIASDLYSDREGKTVSSSGESYEPNRAIISLLSDYRLNVGF